MALTPSTQNDDPFAPTDSSVYLHLPTNSSLSLLNVGSKDGCPNIGENTLRRESALALLQSQPIGSNPVTTRNIETNSSASAASSAPFSDQPQTDFLAVSGPSGRRRHSESESFHESSQGSTDAAEAQHSAPLNVNPGGSTHDLIASNCVSEKQPPFCAPDVGGSGQAGLTVVGLRSPESSPRRVPPDDDPNHPASPPAIPGMLDGPSHNTNIAVLSDSPSCSPQPANGALKGIHFAEKFGFTRRCPRLVRHFGPAFVVSVAYVDPGNFATNMSAGSSFAYDLLWVILWSNVMAIFLQSLSAKLGITTGQNLSQLCRQQFGFKTNCVLWFGATLAAMATDLAEFLGAVMGFYLLFHVPFLAGAAITGIITLLLVALKGKGQGFIEFVIGVLVGVVTIAYLIELILARPDWGEVFLHLSMPSLPQPRSESVGLAVGMLGATVMPHVIYLHSELVQHRRSPEDTLKECARHYCLEKVDIVVAMNIAFVVNSAMTIVAASVFSGGNATIVTLEDAHRSLTPLLGSLSSYAFGIALLASGLSSSAVGTLSGEILMNGFVNLRIPVLVRRLITMAPGLAVLASGFDPMKALVLSQVVLSFALPAAVIPLILLTSRTSVMGEEMVNSWWVRLLGWAIAFLIVAFNATLLVLFVVPI